MQRLTGIKLHRRPSVYGVSYILLDIFLRMTYHRIRGLVGFGVSNETEIRVPLLAFQNKDGIVRQCHHFPELVANVFLSQTMPFL